MQETRVWSLGQEDPLEEEMATHSSIGACRILWTEMAGRLQSMGSQRVRHDWATKISLSNKKGRCRVWGVGRVPTFLPVLQMREQSYWKVKWPSEVLEPCLHWNPDLLHSIVRLISVALRHDFKTVAWNDSGFWAGKSEGSIPRWGFRCVLRWDKDKNSFWISGLEISFVMLTFQYPLDYFSPPHSLFFKFL